MSTNDIALERVQALLKIDTGDGSLYDHVVRIANALATEKPNDALAQLETLSRNLKKATYRGVTAEDVELEIVADAAAEDKRKQYCVDALKLVRQPTDPSCAPQVLCAVQNFMEDAAMFEWAGVGFGKEESFHIAMSLRKLATEETTLQELRLWGKILGTGGDYYIAEGKLEAAGPMGKPALPGSPEYDVEPRGEGANISTYWVSTGGSAPWIRLPAARASHIVASRKIKRLMTGDLGSPVLSTPWFPGKERHLLRAQIARITSTCKLAVAGYYEKDEGGDEEEQAPPGKHALKIVEGALESFKTHEELATLDGWVHGSPGLLNTGKSTWPELDDLEEGVIPEETKAAFDAQKEAEPEKELLAAIGADLEDLKPEDQEGSPAWNIKVYGDKGMYKFEDASKSYRITAVRSLIWPGAITVAQGTRFANLYIGNGLKCATLVDPYKESGLPLTGASPFSSGAVVPTTGTVQLPPLAPEDVMEEPEDQEEQPEPQPELQDDASDGEDMEPEE